MECDALQTLTYLGMLVIVLACCLAALAVITRR